MSTSLQEVPHVVLSTGDCSLCRQPGKLCNSHILPEFFIKGTCYQKPDGEKGQTQPHVIFLSNKPLTIKEERYAKKWQTEFGFCDRALCVNCERKIQVYEDYFRKTFYGNSPQPLRKKEYGTLNVFAPNHPFNSFKGFLGSRVIQVDYPKLKLFQISLLWRASLVDRTYSKAVNRNLGTTHCERLRVMLNEGRPGESWRYSCDMIDISNSLEPSETLIEPYEAFRHKGIYSYRTTAGGFVFSFAVTSHCRREAHLNSSAVSETGLLEIPMFGSALALERIQKRLIR